ncbi:hypothetical protein BGZ97_009475 [Linnemannia gamsii]|uniref:Uncharacterized protein n=1 Tax=Linnemannia gamsii TaxID=64522 RepID=A0A9P6QNG6_9FUNG|nr:hypothetical protein BGZ97_009475 [Linnemannia gamsii]
MIDHITDALTSNNAAPSLHRETSTTRATSHIVQDGDCTNDLFSATRTTAIANSSGDNSNVIRSEDSAVVNHSIPTAGPVLYESIIRLSKAELRELTIANTKANLILSASIVPRNNSNTKANRTRSVRIAPCNNSNTSGAPTTLTELTSISALESTVTRKRHRTSPQQEREAKRSRHNTHGSSTHPPPISSPTTAGHDQSLADSSDMNNNNISGTVNDNDADSRLNKMKRLEEQYSNHDKTSESENHPRVSSPASTSSPCLEASPASTSPPSSASPQWGTLPHRASHPQWTPLPLWTSLPVSLSSPSSAFSPASESSSSSDSDSDSKSLSTSVSPSTTSIPSPLVLHSKVGELCRLTLFHRFKLAFN